MTSDLERAHLNIYRNILTHFLVTCQSIVTEKSQTDLNYAIYHYSYLVWG